jgi:hypothetical protein
MNLRGRFVTDDDGRFHFRSVKPAGYPALRPSARRLFLFGLVSFDADLARHEAILNQSAVNLRDLVHVWI